MVFCWVWRTPEPSSQLPSHQNSPTFFVRVEAFFATGPAAAMGSPTGEHGHPSQCLRCLGGLLKNHSRVARCWWSLKTTQVLQGAVPSLIWILNRAPRMMSQICLFRTTTTGVVDSGCIFVRQSSC